MTDPSPTRAHSVADRLRHRIIAGEIPPDTHLTEQQLSKELGVSRTPVREALGRLAEERLLIYQPNRGFFVRRFGIKDVRDTCNVRATLEAMGCRLIGERALEPASLGPIRDVLEEQRQVLFGHEWNRQRALLWQDLNLDFHFGLLELADNPWLTEAVRRVRHVPLVHSSSRRTHDPESQVLLFQRHHSQQAYSEHVRIVQALERNEWSRAEGLMSEHILTNRDVLVGALAAEGEDDMAGTSEARAREA